MQSMRTAAVAAAVGLWLVVLGCRAEPRATEVSDEIASGRGTGLAAAPTETLMPTAAPGPSSMPTPSTPALTVVPFDGDPRILDDMYTFRVVRLAKSYESEANREVDTLAAVPPGTDELVPILDACAIRLGDVYDHRIVVVVGVGEGPGCEAALSDVYLAIVSTPSLEVQRIRSLGAGLYVRPKWSPDGRYIAYAAALEGASQNLYLYDGQTVSIVRLTDGQYQVEGLQWSPSGDGILYRESEHEMNFSKDHALWWAPLGGEPLVEFRDPDWLGGSLNFHGWLDGARFLFANQGTNDCIGPLYIGNIKTGGMAMVTDITQCWTEVHTLGDESFLLSPTGFNGELSLFRLAGDTATLVADLPFERDFLWDSVALPNHGVFLVNSHQGLVSLRTSGEWEVLDGLKIDRRFNPSPDGRWIAIADNPLGPDFGPLRVFEILPDGQLILRAELGRSGSEWRPDSRALVLECSEDVVRMGWPPFWESVRVEGGCPHWVGWSQSAPERFLSEYVDVLLVEQ